MKDIVDKYINALDTLTEQKGIRQVAEAEHTFQTAEAEDRFDKIKELIKDEYRLITARLDDECRVIVQSAESIATQQTEAIRWPKRVIKFLQEKDDIESCEVKFKPSSIKVYSDRAELNVLNIVLGDGKYFQGRVIILSNDRPKNKYSLIVIGRCAFPNTLIERPYSYGVNWLVEQPYNVLKLIGAFPTKDKAREFTVMRKDKLLAEFLSRVNHVTEEYQYAIRNYKLEDFDCVLKPRKARPDDFKLFCKMDGKNIYKNGHYYFIRAEKVDGHPIDHFLLRGKLIKRWCRIELLRIVQTGNTSFGSWWSMDIEPHCHRTDRSKVFSRENYERLLNEAKNYVKDMSKERRKEIHFSYPKVVWPKE